jgi:hypothetical protein
MSEAVTEYRKKVVERALSGPGVASPEARRAAFENRGVDENSRALIDKVARHAWNVTAEDVAATKAAGVGEDAIFEMSVCAALGQASRQLEAALAALDVASAPNQAAIRHAPAGIRHET